MEDSKECAWEPYQLQVLSSQEGTPLVAHNERPAHSPAICRNVHRVMLRVHADKASQPSPTAQLPQHGDKALGPLVRPQQVAI